MPVGDAAGGVGKSTAGLSSRRERLRENRFASSSPPAHVWSGFAGGVAGTRFEVAAHYD